MNLSGSVGSSNHRTGELSACFLNSIDINMAVHHVTMIRPSEWSGSYGRVEKNSSKRTFLILSFVVASSLMVLTSVEGLPFPAPNFRDCRGSEGCCMGIPKGIETILFKFNPNLPMRTRKAAHLVDDKYIAKYQRAYALLRALPDTDGRSYLNQARLHCAYCDNDFYFPGNTTAYPLEIHNNWLFLPWHRLFVYFHERILAKLLGDDTFTLPYWNWDDQSPLEPTANTVPQLYWDKMYKNRSSSLYDANRNACARPPSVIDFNAMLQTMCANKTADYQRFENSNVMFTHMVTGAVTPILFFGQPYRFGDVGGPGAGTLELKPHGPVHVWTNQHDMGNFKWSAREPLFFAHHTNIDRMWDLWKALPGGIRKELTDPDYLNTEFSFFDENGKVVIAKVSQVLDLEPLRYKYQKRPTDWVTAGLSADKKSGAPLCNPLSSSDVDSMIRNTPSLNSSAVLTETLTFRIRRPPLSSVGEEVLVLEGIHLNWTQTVIFDVYLYFPDAQGRGNISCPEYIGVLQQVPHVGIDPETPTLLWRGAIGEKLRLMKREPLSHIVVTLVHIGSPAVTRFTDAKVVYLNQ